MFFLLLLLLFVLLFLLLLLINRVWQWLVMDPLLFWYVYIYIIYKYILFLLLLLINRVWQWLVMDLPLFWYVYIIYIYIIYIYNVFPSSSSPFCPFIPSIAAYKSSLAMACDGPPSFLVCLYRSIIYIFIYIFISLYKI